MPSDHRRAKLACPSRPSSLSREQRTPSKRELSPPLRTPNQPLPFANFCFSQYKTHLGPRAERQRTPETAAPGERVEHRCGHSTPPPASSPPLLPFSYVFRWDCGCAGVVLSRESAGWRWSPKVPGDPHPGVLPAQGRGAEALTAIGNTQRWCLQPGPAL